MTKTKIIAAVGASALALAAGSASAQDWTGFYAGGFAGWQMLNEEDDETILFDTNLDNNYGDTVRTGAGADAFSPGFCGGSPNDNNAGAGCEDDEQGSGEIGARVGYDWQTGPVVVGVVGEFSKLSTEDHVTGFSTTPASYTFEREIQHLIAVRMRLGLSYGRFLPYVTGGYASGEIEDTYSTSNVANSFTPTKKNQDAEGYQIGAGVETMVTDTFSVGVEYLFTSLDTDPLIVRTGPGTAPATNPFLLVNTAGTNQRRSNDDTQLHGFRLTGTFRF